MHKLYNHTKYRLKICLITYKRITKYLKRQSMNNNKNLIVSYSEIPYILKISSSRRLQ